MLTLSARCLRNIAAAAPPNTLRAQAADLRAFGAFLQRLQGGDEEVLGEALQDRVPFGRGGMGGRDVGADRGLPQRPGTAGRGD